MTIDPGINMSILMIHEIEQKGTIMDEMCAHVQHSNEQLLIYRSVRPTKRRYSSTLTQATALTDLGRQSETVSALVVIVAAVLVPLLCDHRYR